MKALLIALLLALPFSTQAGQVLFTGEATSNYPPDMVLDPGTLTCPGGEYVPGPIPQSIACSEGSRIHMNNVVVQTFLTLHADYNPDRPNDSALFDSVGAVEMELLSARWNPWSEGPYTGEVRPFIFDNLVAKYVMHGGTFTAKRTMMEDHWLSETTYKMTGYRLHDNVPVKLVIHMDYVLFSAIPLPHELYNIFFGVPTYYPDYVPSLWYYLPEGNGTFVLSVDDEG